MSGTRVGLAEPINARAAGHLGGGVIDSAAGDVHRGLEECLRCPPHTYTSHPHRRSIAVFSALGLTWKNGRQAKITIMDGERGEEAFHTQQHAATAHMLRSPAPNARFFFFFSLSPITRRTRGTRRRRGCRRRTPRAGRRAWPWWLVAVVFVLMCVGRVVGAKTGEVAFSCGAQGRQHSRSAQEKGDPKTACSPPFPGERAKRLHTSASAVRTYTSPLYLCLLSLPTLPAPCSPCSLCSLDALSLSLSHCSLT